MKFVVTGGGTGGHIYPALAIARGIKDRFGAEVFYIGGSRGLESEIVPREGLPFEAIRLEGFRRRLSPANIMVAWRAAIGVGKARRLLRTIGPAAVIGTGGYVCGPVVLAAASLGIPAMLHEQNALPGITNKILSRFSRYVTLTFEEAGRYFPAGAGLRTTGLPVRKEIFGADRELAREKLNVPRDTLLVLSFGGSQGARSLNNAVIPVLRRFAGHPGIWFIHVTGPANYDRFLAELKSSINLPDQGNITITSYMHDMPSALAAADLAICRAGAATCAELTAVGLPAILIPYPYAAENHQEYNARALEKKGAAIVIRDRELTGEALVSQLERLTGNRGRLAEMAGASRGMGRPRALDDILDCLRDLLESS